MGKTQNLGEKTRLVKDLCFLPKLCFFGHNHLAAKWLAQPYTIIHKWEAKKSSKITSTAKQNGRLIHLLNKK